MRFLRREGRFGSESPGRFTDGEYNIDGFDPSAEEGGDAAATDGTETHGAKNRGPEATGDTEGC